MRSPNCAREAGRRHQARGKRKQEEDLTTDFTDYHRFIRATKSKTNKCNGQDWTGIRERGWAVWMGQVDFTDCGGRLGKIAFSGGPDEFSEGDRLKRLFL